MVDIRKEIDRLHKCNGRIVDAMNEDICNPSEAKELISINASKIEYLKNQLNIL